MRKKIATWAGLALAVVVATAALSPAFALGEAEGGGAAGADAVALAAAEPAPIGAAAIAPAESLAPNVAPIEAVALTVGAPVAGGTPSTTVTVPDGAGYTAEVMGWYLGEEPFAEIFEVGKTYTVSVQVRADEGCSFSSSAAVTINGSTATVTAWEGGGLFMCEKSFTVPSNNAYIVMTSPDKDRVTPIPRLDDGRGEAGTIESVEATWYSVSHDENGVKIRLDITGKVPSPGKCECDLVITPAAGYPFDAGSIFYLNGEDKTADASMRISEDGNMLCTLEYTVLSGGGGCTIVSLFGDDAPQTAKLRDFRDDALMQSAVGQALVGLYYDVSPAVVAFLDEHPVAHSAAYGLIDAFASIVPAREGGSL